MLITIIDVLYTISSAVMLFFYIPQILKVISARPPVAGVALPTWAAWAICTFVSFLYGAFVVDDFKLAYFSLGGAICCALIFGITFVKRYNFNIKRQQRKLKNIGRIPPKKLA